MSTPGGPLRDADPPHLVGRGGEPVEAAPGAGVTALPRRRSWVRNPKLGYAAAVAAAVISGVSIYVNSLTVKSFTDPVLYTAVKDGLVGVVLLVPLAVLPAKRAEVRQLDRRTWSWLVALALTGGSVPFALFFTGLQLTTAATGAVLNHLQFVFVALLAAIFLRERIPSVMWVALVVLLLGALLGTNLHALHWNVGAVLIAISSVLFAIDFVIAKHLLRGLSTLTIMTARMSMGTFLLLLYLAAIGRLGGIARLSGSQWELAGLTGFLLLLFTIATFTAIRHASVSAVIAIGAASPIVTTLLQVGLARQVRLDPVDLAGLGLILAATLAVLGLGLRKDVATLRAGAHP